MKLLRAIASEIQYTPGIEYSGVILEFQKVAIHPKSAGRIEKIFVDKGMAVKKNQILIKMEQLPLKINLENQRANIASSRAKVNLANEKMKLARMDIEKKLKAIDKQSTHVKELKAKMNKGRITFKGKKQLYSQGGLSKEEYHQSKIVMITLESEFLKAKKDLEILKIGYRNQDLGNSSQSLSRKNKRQKWIEMNTAVEKAELQFAKAELGISFSDLKASQLLYNETIIRSPLTGIIAIRNNDPGEQVAGSGNASGDPVLVLIDIAKVYVVLQVKEHDIQKIKRGTIFEFKVDVLGDKLIKSKIELISPIIDPRSHTFEVRSIIQNKDLFLRPGMFLRGKLLTKKSGKYIKVSQKAVVSNKKGESFVFVVRKSHAFKVKVKTGEKVEDAIIVLSGLKIGDQVVIGKQAALSDGIKVSIQAKQKK